MKSSMAGTLVGGEVIGGIVGGGMLVGGLVGGGIVGGGLVLGMVGKSGNVGKVGNDGTGKSGGEVCAPADESVSPTVPVPTASTNARRRFQTCMPAPPLADARFRTYHSQPERSTAAGRLREGDARTYDWS